MAAESFVRIFPGSNTTLALGVDHLSKVVLQIASLTQNNQVWRWQPLENGLPAVSIIHHLTGKPLTWLQVNEQVQITGAREAEAVDQQIWNCAPIDEIGSSVKRITSSKDDSLSLEVRGEILEGNSIVIAPWQGIPGQQWTITELPLENMYPAPLASQEAVMEDRTVFFTTLNALHSHFGTTLKVPCMGGKDLDLHLLYREVAGRGGLGLVIKEGAWKTVVAQFNFPPSITNASFVLRKYYFNLLYHYEKVYLFGAKGPLETLPSSLPPPTPVDLKIKPDGLTSAAQAAIASSNKRGPAAMIGQAVTGAIYGKFDCGYLVSVQVGQEKLKGVLYHSSARKSTGGLSMGMNAYYLETGTSGQADKRRRKSKKGPGQSKDPKAPKAHRSGYNFFFQEWRKRLKEEHPALHDREITSMVGKKWSGLSEEDRVPYKHLSIADKERHFRELEAYNQEKFQGFPPVASLDASILQGTGVLTAVEEVGPDADTDADGNVDGEGDMDGDGDGDVEGEGEGEGDVEREIQFLPPDWTTAGQEIHGFQPQQPSNIPIEAHEEDYGE